MYEQNNELLVKLEAEMDRLAPEKKPREGGITFFTFEKNVNKTYFFRPLPSKIQGNLLPVEKLHIHYNFYNPNTERNGAFPCLKSQGISCPLSLRVEQMKNDPNFEVQEKALDFEPAESCFLYVKEMNTGEIGVLTFSGKRATEAINGKLKEILIESGGKFNGTELERGVVLQIDKSGVKFGTQYQVMIVQRDHVLSQEDIVTYNDLPPLHKVYGDYTPQIYEKILKGEKFELGEQNTSQKTQNLNPNSTVQITNNPMTQENPYGTPTGAPPKQEASVKNTGYSPPAENTQTSVQSYTPPAENTLEKGPGVETSTSPTATPTVEELQKMLGK